MYYLLIVTLEECPYSIATINLLDTFKIIYKHLKVKIKDKENFKTIEIDTFPQIYLKKNKTNDTLLLGGYNDLNEFINTFIKQNYCDENKIKFQLKYKYWHKKPILRLIELFNQKQGSLL